MPKLSNKFFKHHLPINQGHKLYKQHLRKMSKEIKLKIKKEIQCILKVGFIKPAWYVEWLSNVVSVVMKNRKLKVCVDSRNLNEYPISIIDMLINRVTRHQYLSFMDNYSSYNQNMIVEEDVEKKLHLVIQEKLVLVNCWHAIWFIEYKGHITEANKCNFSWFHWGIYENLHWWYSGPVWWCWKTFDRIT